MSSISVNDVRAIVQALLNQRLKALGIESLPKLTDDYDLLRCGFVDSLGFVELLTAVAAHFDKDVDFAEIDPEQMTIVGPLCTFISERLAKA